MGTTKALNRVHLLVLRRDNWKTCEREIKQRKISEMVTFMKRTPLFDKLSHTFLTTKLMPCFFNMDCNKDHCVFREGDFADKIYIILKGEFICTKMAVLKPKDKTNFDSDDPIRKHKINISMSIKNTKKFDQHFVAYYYIGKMLGEADILSHHKGEGSGRYTTTVKCNSKTGKLIYIRKAEFLKLQNQT